MSHFAPSTSSPSHLVSALASLSLNEPKEPSQHTPPTAMSDLQSVGSRPRQILPPLATFSGERSEYAGWLVAAKLKIEVDGDAIGSEKGKIAVVNAALEGSARAACTTYVRALLTLANPQLDSLFDYLDKLYDDPHAIQTAMTKWANLRQGTRTFATFFSDFERLMYEAGASAWPAASQIERLMASISDELADRLVGVKRPSDFMGTVSVLRSIANDLEQLRIRRKTADQRSHKINTNKNTTNGMTNGGPPFPQKKSGRLDMMEWEASRWYLDSY